MSLQQWFVKNTYQTHIFAMPSKNIRAIHNDEIDILVDLDSITFQGQCELLSTAAIQVTWLGWDASGLPSVDYYR